MIPSFATSGDMAKRLSARAITAAIKVPGQGQPMGFVVVIESALGEPQFFRTSLFPC